MADSTSIRCINFGDMISIVANRGQIAGSVQDRDLNFIKGSLNEHNIRISTERNWSWRKFDRDYVFNTAITTGTVAVTNNSRAVIFTGLTLDNSHVGKSFKVSGTSTLYRIIGVNIGTSTAYLSTSYVGSTNASATFKIYNYEFPLPPDCDKIVQINYDFPVNGLYGPREVNYTSNLEFNRSLSSGMDFRYAPAIYTRDGKISADSLPPLDVMLLDYDFLGGDVFDKVDKLRVFPIEPDIARVLHINYSVQVENMAEDNDVPLMPVDNRWVLVNFALADWFSVRGQNSSADRLLIKANNMLREMRNEHESTDPAPKFKSPLSKYRRSRIYYDNNLDLLLLSRIVDV